MEVFSFVLNVNAGVRRRRRRRRDGVFIAWMDEMVVETVAVCGSLKGDLLIGVSWRRRSYC